MDFRREHCIILRGYSHFKTVCHKGLCSEFSLVLMLVAIDLLLIELNAPAVVGMLDNPYAIVSTVNIQVYYSDLLI